MIEEKKTFKGYVNKAISIEDFIKLEAGYTIKNLKKNKETVDEIIKKWY